MKVELKEYTKKIKDKVVLDKISLSFSSGMVYGLYGRNGSGKTMLMRAISTLILPTSGDVVVDGISIIQNAFDLRQIGILLDESSFYPYLTGLENISLLYEINHKKDIAKMMEILKLVGLEGKENEMFGTYSLGMKQKLRIAQTFMEDQKIILLDEPSNGLDASSIQQLYKLVQSLKQQDRLIIMASHIKEDIETLCDVVYHLEDGRVIQ